VTHPRPLLPLGTNLSSGCERLEHQQSGRGKSSALSVEERIVNVWKLRRGKCVELRIFSTIEEALEATGPPA
jgi:hypothetical protein